MKATRYFDDFTVGEVFWTDGVTIDQCDINLFAGLSGDHNPLHTDEEYSRRNTSFGGRIAHGFLVISKMSGKFNQLGFWDGSVIAMKENGWKFLTPVKPGDTIRAMLTVRELTPAKKPGSGDIVVGFDVINQNETKAVEGFLKLKLKTRETAKA